MPSGTHFSEAPGPYREGRDLSGLPFETEYRTGESDLARDFYRPCLLHATAYDRAVGYFRSSVYAIAGDSTIDFAANGGRIRLVCSPDLSAEDWEAIGRGYNSRTAVIEASLQRDIAALLHSSHAERTEFLATLIQLGVLDVRIAVREPEQGIFHEKIGIFADQAGNHVSFKGSSNETWSGWHNEGNLESIEVFCSWRLGNEAVRVLRHREYFEKLWRGQIRHLEVLAFPEASRRQLLERARPDLQYFRTHMSAPARRTPLPHQASALREWRARDRRGILQHATGSGKTFTALLAIEQHVSAGRVALVLVPSKLLLEQWATEIQQSIPDAVTLLAGAGRGAWKQSGRLERFSAANPALGPRIILATMPTASKPEFRHRLSQGPDLLLVADEVHQTGSRENSRLYGIDAGARLGLSATPRRYGDPDGTSRMLEYFGGIVPPPFTLEDAIQAGRLVQYEYFPHAVYLTAEESELWRDFTRRISLEIARSPKEDGSVLLTQRAKLLLIQRSRIAKKASAKIRLATDILVGNYQEGQRWLVYCEDTEQLTQVLSELTAGGVPAMEYHSEMKGNPAATLDWLEKFGGVVVSIRCLDEGVDIPSVSHALILASSQNPRQFIQRRGRVLRTSSDKHLAVVHDAIVVPLGAAEEPEQAALARSELARALEFSDSAINRGAGAELREIAHRLGIDPYTLNDSGIEEEHADD
jgi:superfamily II DNA or RNA helicase